MFNFSNFKLLVENLSEINICKKRNGKNELGGGNNVDMPYDNTGEGNNSDTKSWELFLKKNWSEHVQRSF
jgi:hypothetical protein